MISDFSTAVRKAIFDKPALTVVLAIWAGMVGTLCVFVAVYDRNLPLWEFG